MTKASKNPPPQAAKGTKNDQIEGADVDTLLAIMARLRNPDGGCPWDIEQTFSSIAPHTIEEAYEVADAITRNDMPALKEELGDLLLQVIFHAQMARESGEFSFQDVVTELCNKLVRRHPHVFGNEAASSASDVNVIWDAAKDKEKDKTQAGSLLDGVTLGLPAVLRAQKLQKKAAKVGFVWPDAKAAKAKMDDEMAELDEAIASKDPAAIADEFGDVLFCLVNYGRMLGVDGEEALRITNDKFLNQFKSMEQKVKAEYKEMKDLPLTRMLELWRASKINK